MTAPTFTAVEAAAHTGAFGDNDQPLPTEAQRRAGNYRMGRVTLHGLRIAIEQPRGTVRAGTAPDGTAWSCRLAAHYGYFVGTTGADGDGVDVFIAPNPAAEVAYVINQNVGGRFDEHKVVLGAVDEDHARQLYLASYARGWRGLASIVTTTIPQLKHWLRHGNKRRALTADQLHQGTPTMNRVFWNSDARPEGLSLDEALYHVRIADAGENLLLDAVSMTDILEDSEGVIALDAMVVPVNLLARKMDVLKAIMGRAGDKVKPLDVQVSEPFKQRGVTNVAAVFELSDGQTVSIYFHNPDTTPSRLAPTDDLVSWKWLLNKKDITIVVAPERGADLNPREVARRVMRLAEKNSAAFARVNAKRAERMATIQSLKGEVAELETELERAQRELEVEQILAEERLSNPVPAPEPEPVAPAAASGKPRMAESAEALWDAITVASRGVPRDDGVRYPVVSVVPGDSYQIAQDGAEINIFTDASGVTVRPATAEEIEELHRAIRADQVQVSLPSRPGYGSDYKARGAGEILHSPSGSAFGAPIQKPELAPADEEPETDRYGQNIAELNRRGEEWERRIDEMSDGDALKLAFAAGLTKAKSVTAKELLLQEHPDDLDAAFAKVGAEGAAEDEDEESPAVGGDTLLDRCAEILNAIAEQGMRGPFWFPAHAGDADGLYVVAHRSGVRLMSATPHYANRLNSNSPVVRNGSYKGNVLLKSWPSVSELAPSELADEVAAVKAQRDAEAQRAEREAADAKAALPALANATPEFTAWLAEHGAAAGMVEAVEAAVKGEGGSIVWGGDATLDSATLDDGAYLEAGSKAVAAANKLLGYFRDFIRSDATMAAIPPSVKGLPELLNTADSGKMNKAEATAALAKMLDVAINRKAGAELSAKQEQRFEDFQHDARIIYETLNLRSRRSGRNILRTPELKARYPEIDNPAAYDAAVVFDGMVAAKAVIAGLVLDDASHAIATLQNALDTVTNNEPINRAEGNIAQADLEVEAAASFREALDKLGATALDSAADDEGDDFDEDAEWEATPEEEDEEPALDGVSQWRRDEDNRKARELSDDELDGLLKRYGKWNSAPEDRRWGAALAAEKKRRAKKLDSIALDGDFVGHPFRGNQYRKGSRTSGTAVAASIHAKKTARTGSAREVRTAHRIAHHSHAAASLAVTTGTARRYHRKMARLHAKHAGVEAALDSAREDEWFVRHYKSGFGVARRIPGQPGLYEYYEKPGSWRASIYKTSDAARKVADSLNASLDSVELLDGVSEMHATAVLRNAEGAEAGMVLIYQDGSAGVRDAGGNRAVPVTDDVAKVAEGVRLAMRGKTSDRNAMIEAMKVLQPFLSSAQKAVMGNGARGEEKQFFYDKAVELANTIRDMPETYGQDGKGDEAVAYLHYFKGGADWYITEKDAGGGDVENVQQQAFGLADLYGDGGELGYISIAELTAAGVELDLHWEPKTLAAIRGKGGAVLPADGAENEAGPDAADADDELVEAGVLAAKQNGIAKIATSDYFTMDFGGDDVTVDDELRGKIEAVLGEKLVEATVPGLEAQVTLVPESMAPAAAEPEQVDTDLSRVEALRKLVAEGDIRSDDPDMLEKLHAKLNHRAALGEMMRKANRLLRKGDDAGLRAMGFSDKVIAGLKTPDFAGRTGFPDYEMSNNSGEISRLRKRIEQAERQRAEQAAPEAEAGEAPQLAQDKALFQSVIDGTVADILAPSLADDLEAAFLRHESDPVMAGLFEQAVNAYQAAMMTATASL